MSCNHPCKAFWTGCYTENGKKEYIRMPGSFGDRLNVKMVKTRIGPAAPLAHVDGNTFLVDPIDQPCNKCIGCRLTKSRAWTIRLVHESVLHENVFFVTLTYDDSHIPRQSNGLPVLDRDAISDFMKRLRTYTGRAFRFFGCGEYGSVTKRPHYHLIIFGDLDVGEFLQPNVFKSSDIEKAWKFGLHECSYADVNCMAYVAGYVVKKQKDFLTCQRDVKPYIRMSTHPGIGFGYLKHLDGTDYLVYGPFGKSMSASIPYAYRKKLDDADWMPAYKKWLEEKCKSSTFDQGIVFGTFDQDLQGFCKDGVQLRFMKERRLDKI